MKEGMIPQGTLKILSIKDIHWDKRYREDFGDIDVLAASIKEKGIIQPITVSPDMVLLAGERRIRAAIQAGLQTIPALIRKIEGPIDAREIELIENLIRKDFTWSEQCGLIQEIDQLYKSKNIDWSGRKTAQLLDKGTATISRALQLANAIKEIPELAEEKTADDAFKILKKLEENAIVHELRSRQMSPENKGLEKGIKVMLAMADGNYNIGDTFKGLAELRSNGIPNVIECDPPYGIDLTKVKRSKDSVTSNVHTYNEVAKEAYPVFLTKLAKELYRVAHQHCWLVFWYGPSWHTEVLAALKAAKWAVDEIPCIWVKKQGQTMQPEMYLGRAYESFFLARKGIPALIKRGRLNVFEFSGVSNKYHPTERPVPLLEDILETLTTPGSFVLVPFLGSGATLRAAYNCGMRGFGWEINPEYKDKFMLAVENDSRHLNREEDPEEE